MRAVITGATGTIGKQLVEAISGELTVLSRDPEAAAGSIRAAHFVRWDGHSELDPALFEGVDAVFHLAGEPVAEGRWTAAKKRRIQDSRVLGTRAIVDAMGKAGKRPRAFVCASAVGYYASRGDETLTEGSGRGEGFLADVCARWELEASAAEAVHGVRTSMLRIGIVLSNRGGALTKMLPLFKWGLATQLGSGQQWMPWIHADDVVGLLVHAAEQEHVRGPVNAVAPECVTNGQFTLELARALGRPALLSAPATALRLAMGEVAAVVLASQRVEPRVALRSGYRFVHPTLIGALAHLVGTRGASVHLEAHP